MTEFTTEDGARRQAKIELARAADAAARAARQEAMLVGAPESLRPLIARLAEVHRRSERRHLASVDVYRLLASRMDRREDGPTGSWTPAFLADLAGLVGSTSALVVLGGQRSVVAVAVSDSVARQAHDLETVMAEGPVHDAVTAGLPVLAEWNDLLDRWPCYGPAVADLGVRAVIAAPLGPPAARFGAICALGGEPVVSDNAAVTVDGITRALTSVLVRDVVYDNPDGGGVLPGLGAVSHQDVVNQAIGMVSVQCGCSVEDAADLIAARAFAEELPIEDLAAQVIARRLRLAE